MTNAKLTRVVLWMVGALLSFCVMAVSIRGLAAQGFSIFEILGVRSAVAIILLATAALLRPTLRAQVRVNKMKLHLTRNVAQCVAR